jgi:hypothetical protein
MLKCKGIFLLQRTFDQIRCGFFPRPKLVADDSVVIYPPIISSTKFDDNDDHSSIVSHMAVNGDTDHRSNSEQVRLVRIDDEEEDLDRSTSNSIQLDDIRLPIISNPRRKCFSSKIDDATYTPFQLPTDWNNSYDAPSKKQKPNVQNCELRSSTVISSIRQAFEAQRSDDGITFVWNVLAVCTLFTELFKFCFWNEFIQK